MRTGRRVLKTILLALLLAPAAIPVYAQDASWLGRWEGSFHVSDTEIRAVFTVFSGGALLDLPTERAYGWPVEEIRAQGQEFYFSVLLGGSLLEGAGVRVGDAVSGTLIQGDQKGEFSLQFASVQPDGSDDRNFDTGRGVLPGTLRIPAGQEGPVPLIVLLPGSGTTDRNGNNWQVPGRNDSFAQLADALAAEGIASYRYDKRGAGQAYRLGADESSFTFADHVADAAACLRSFEGDKRFSPILVFGHADGALIGAAALRTAHADGLIVMGASGRTLRDLIQEAAQSAPEEYKAEITAILSELDAGRFVDKVSPFLENLFRRSFQPYLASWLRYDLKKELADLSAGGLPVLLLQGDLDLQVTMAEFDLLRQAAPSAEAVLLPGTNHMLKLVDNDVEENYASFSDPSFPLSPGLVPAIEDFLPRVPRETPKIPLGSGDRNP